MYHTRAKIIFVQHKIFYILNERLLKRFEQALHDESHE